DALAKYAAHLLSETSGTDGAASSSSLPSAQQFFTPSLTKIAEATLPTNCGEFRVAAFRDGYGVDHAVLIAPGSNESGQAPLVRVHSECLTGDALGSLRCDCGPQLHSAMAEVAEAGGAIIYLRGHEGRGIGLAAKIAAYALQDDGLDTVEANRYLGLPVDARDYSVAADILRTLEMNKIRLLTNNPEKSEALMAAGIEVLELVPLVVGLTAANLNYLETKRDRMGHLLTLDEQSEIE
ncbi:MAG: GTP cyclohydrolase II, partial [Promicromonosporaceae bacterium]|nr:GTP cyclohydrolase II [Promicromonosporaceae bacterium]